MITKKRRFLFVLFLALTVCLSTAIPTFATDELPVTEENTEKQILSELPDDELLLFLEENGVAIPVGLADSLEEAVEIIRLFIVDIEQEPDIVFLYGLTQLQDLGDALKPVVNNYYGISVDSTFRPYASHGLRDSSLYYTTPNASKFNCYAFAIGQSEWCNPGQFSGYIMTSSDLKLMSVSDIAVHVKEDLQKLNFPCVKIVADRPLYNSLAVNQSAICVRKGSNGRGKYDYHFMRLYGVDVWRHKPGESEVLTYDYLPSNSRSWIGEGYVDGKVVTSDIVYDSEIYYILFAFSHNHYSHGYTGNNYHKGGKHYYEYADICGDCGTQIAGSSTWVTIECSGPPCMEVLNLEAVD